jgi:hypothetical protein
MEMKETLRQIINKDDGKYFYVENHDLYPKEIVGYIFLVLALFVYSIVDKAGFQHGWLGLMFLLTGVVFLTLGINKNEQRPNT